jgi:hypothetical protein
MDPELLALMEQAFRARNQSVGRRPEPAPPTGLVGRAIGTSNAISDALMGASRGIAGFTRETAQEALTDPRKAYTDYVRGLIGGTLGLARFMPGETRIERALTGAAERVRPEETSRMSQIGAFAGEIVPDVTGADIPLVPGRMREAETGFGKTLEALALLPFGGTLARMAAPRRAAEFVADRPRFGLLPQQAPALGQSARELGDVGRNIVRGRHYGAGADQDALLTEFMGTGREGSESFNPDRTPRTYFYLPGVTEEMTGRPFRPEVVVASGQRAVDVDLDLSKMVNDEGIVAYQADAREILTAQKAGQNIDPTPTQAEIENLATEMMIADGAEGMFSLRRGMAAKFTDTALPSPATGRGLRRTKAQAVDYVTQARALGRQIAPHTDAVEYLPVSPERGQQIADLYDELPHDPTNPEVAASYQAFAEETKDQYEYLVQRGVQFEPNVGDPYATSADMIEDVASNNRLKFYLTDLNDFPADHPMAAPSGVVIDMPDGTQREMVYNDLFRAVHDYFGHSTEGFQFGPRGEDNAWALHSAMYSDQARGAMSFETRGQNSWVNFGSQMRNAEGQLMQTTDPGFLAPADRAFAPQKANILPREMMQVRPDPVDPSVIAGAGRELPRRPRNAASAAQARLEYDTRTPQRVAARRAAIEQGLTPEQVPLLAGKSKGFQENVERMYSLLPTPETFAHAAIRGASTRGWYLGAGRTIREGWGADAPRFTALMAAMSPNKSVQENVKFATQTWAAWIEAGRPSSAEEIQKLGIIQSPLPADFNNSVTALTASAQDLEQGVPTLLSGGKVGPFYANLLGAVNPITHDTHMARGYGTLPGGVTTQARVYAQDAMVGNAAREFERLTGVPVSRREIQEMTWGYIRGLTEAAGKKGKALDALEEAFVNPSAKLTGGLELQERIADAAPMGDLLAQPEYADALRRAGIANITPYSPVGVPTINPEAADIQSLRNIAQRIDLVRSGNPLYTAAPLLAAGGATAKLQAEMRERQN